MNVEEGKGVKFLNNPVLNVREALMNANSTAARVGQTRANKAAALVEARSGINHPRPTMIRNTKETGNLTAALRGLNAYREAFLNQQQFMSQEMARAALAAHATQEASKPKCNNCKQQGGKTRKIKRKAHRKRSYKNVKGYRSR